MARIWIWNSQSTRRRSASDTFEENGIHILKSHVTGHNHTVEIVDWATEEGYNHLSPYLLKKVNRLIFEKLLASRKGSVKAFVLLVISMLVQGLLSFIQANRLKTKLVRLAKQVRSERLRIFGIKVWYGEAFTWSKFLVNQIHRFHPECIVIAGGYHVSLYQTDILHHSAFDLAVVHEGETTLTAILNAIDSFQQSGNSWHKKLFLQWLTGEDRRAQLSGLIYWLDGAVQTIPPSTPSARIPPDKAIPLYATDNGKTKIHILLDSLGCPWSRCHFCVHNQFNPFHRSRAVDEIINEIKLMARQGIGLFRFAGSDTPLDHAGRIASSVLANRLAIEFTMGARVVSNCRQTKRFREVVEAYTICIKAGLRGVFIGGETGHDTINNQVMNKGVTADDIVHTIRAIREAESQAGIKVSVSLALIYPVPLLVGVTDQAVLESNLELLRQTLPDSAVISPPAPFKNSAWYRERDKFGFKLAADNIPAMMEYEYVLSKPLQFWPELNIRLQGKSFKTVLAETQHFRQLVEKDLTIPTDLSDEHFLMIRAAGLFSPTGIAQFKRNALIDIVSSDYTYLNRISLAVNSYSRILAETSLSNLAN